MKRILLFILMLSVLGFAQSEYSGDKITFDTLFVNTDSLRLLGSGIDTLLTDTLYSKAFIIDLVGGEYPFTVAAYIDSVGGATDSVALDVRLGYTFTKTRNVLNVQWSPWHTIFDVMKRDTLYRDVTTSTDTTWWMGADVLQYRLRHFESDTALHNVSHFIR